MMITSTPQQTKNQPKTITTFQKQSMLNIKWIQTYKQAQDNFPNLDQYQAFTNSRTFRTPQGVWYTYFIEGAAVFKFLLTNARNMPSNQAIFNYWRSH